MRRWLIPALVATLTACMSNPPYLVRSGEGHRATLQEYFTVTGNDCPSVTTQQGDTLPGMTAEEILTALDAYDPARTWTVRNSMGLDLDERLGAVHADNGLYEASSAVPLNDREAICEATLRAIQNYNTVRTVDLTPSS